MAVYQAQNKRQARWWNLNLTCIAKTTKKSATRETLQSRYIIRLIRIPVVKDCMEEGNSKKRLKVELHTKWPTNSIHVSLNSTENTVLDHLLANSSRHLVCQPLILPTSIHSCENHFPKITIWLCQFLHKQDLISFEINFLVAAYGPSWSNSRLPHNLHFSPSLPLYVSWGPGITN